MKRVIDEKIKKPIVDEILFGKLSKTGGTLEVDYVKQELKFNYKAKSKSKKS